MGTQALVPPLLCLPAQLLGPLRPQVILHPPLPSSQQVAVRPGSCLVQWPPTLVRATFSTSSPGSPSLVPASSQAQLELAGDGTL